MNLGPISIHACGALCALAFYTSAWAVANDTTTGRADVIVVNGHILTKDAHDTIVQALAIRDGRIVAVGSNTTIRSFVGRGAQVIDLHGHTATPGLIDTHAHVLEGGLDALLSVDLSAAKSIADVRRLISERAATLAPGAWLTGSGWDEGKLAERRYIVAADIDDIVPSNPVWLEHTTGHYGVANSAALAIAGVSATTADPAAGTIDRDRAGHPTGVLKESAQELATRRIPDPTPADRRKAILNTIALMNSEGMTGYKEPGITEQDWTSYESLARSNELHAHVCVLRRWGDDPAIASSADFARTLLSMPRAPKMAAPNLALCGVKIFMDGSGGARTAWMYDDWHKNSVDVDTGNTGYPSIDPDTYRAAVHVFHAAGLHVSTHAIGDRAIDWVVDTYAEVLREHPIPGLRHGIIHANTPTNHALDVMQTLQHDFDAAYPETQAEFTWWIGDNYAGNLGPARAGRLNPYQTYLRRGIRFGGGSDFPVTPLPARFGLWSSVSRSTLRGTYGTHPFGTAESIGINDALSSYTVWAAHQLFLDDEAGSLEPGKSADIAVWDKDLSRVATDEVKQMKCELTLFRGAVVYRAHDAAVSVTTLRPKR